MAKLWHCPKSCEERFVMWYVVQTQSGSEEIVAELMKKLIDPGAYKRCFIPLFEDVRKKNGQGMIFLHRFFPGYFFVETDEPEAVFKTIRRIPEFTRILGSRDEDGDIVFLPVGKEDEEFLNTLLDQGVMRVSYIRRSSSGRIERLIGPLEKYSNHITKLDIPRRRALVEVDLFGKKRRFKFGLWTDDDPPIAWITDRLGKGRIQEAPIPETADIGIHPGDKIIYGADGDEQVYGDQIFIVEKVDIKHRKVITTLPMLNTYARIEFSADEVIVVG